MKSILHQLASYHAWANETLIKFLLQLPDADWQQEVKSSFNTLQKTVQHMWDAESIWWQRMKLTEKITVPGENFSGSPSELAHHLVSQDLQWLEWIRNAQEHMLQHEFIYQNSKKEQFKQPVYQVLIQLFNHGTYHRGQIVTMLRSMGKDKIPATDFIVFSRKKQN